MIKQFLLTLTQRLISILLFIGGVPMFLSAKTNTSIDKNIEMADYLRRSGKIYIVVAVVLTIFVGVLIYLFYIDRKITNIENTEKDKS